jgi:hypothetical protein
LPLNFKEALATLSRALPAVLFRAGVFIAGGFAVILFFGIVLFAFRLAGGASPFIIFVVVLIAIMGGWACGRVLQRLFLYRQRAALLFLFSQRSSTFGLAAAIHEAERFFPDHSSWAVLNRDLRRDLFAFYHNDRDFPNPPAATPGGPFSRAIDRLAGGMLVQAILVLAFSRGSSDPGRSVREGLALSFRHGTGSRRLARQWLWFLLTGLAFLFLCLAIPNWFFFRGTGTPVGIGIVLAAIIAWLLHQAFVQPLVLAGVSGALLAETRDKTPDADLCEKLESRLPATALLGKKKN